MHTNSSQNTYRSIAMVLIRFSLPLIFSGILQQLYSWADAYIVGNVVGETALAAIGATGTVINFFLMLITGFTLGLAILFGQKYGASELDSLSGILSTFVLLLGAIAAILCAVSIYFTRPLLVLLNTTPDSMEMAFDYLQIIFIGIPFLAVYNVYSAALRGIGDSRAPFLAVLISSVVNVILDIVFVVYLHLGVKGAAAATILSQISMTLFMIIYTARKHPVLRYRINRTMFHSDALRQGLHLGIPPMIQSSVNAFGGLILQNFMNGFGTHTVIAITTAYRVDCIALLPIVNLGSGISTITAQHHGAGDAEKARKTLFVGTILMSVVSVALTLLIIPTGGFLVSLFGAGREATAIGHAFFIRLSVFYVIFGLSTSIRGYLEGVGDVMFSSFTGIIQLVVRIILSYAFASVFGNMIIAYAEGAAWTLMFLMYLIRVLYYKPKKVNMK